MVGGGDHTLLSPQAQDPVPAFRGRSEGDLALPGSVGRGGVEKTGEGSSLREGQRAGVLAEKAPGGDFGPVGPVSEIHSVQVGGKDLFFRIVLLVGEAREDWTKRLQKEISSRSSSGT